MADKVSKEKRSFIMSRIRSKNTKPENLIRKALWRRGVRYRMHNRKIPGTPDISNKRRRVAVFVDGCFWHGCKMCYVEPKTNRKYWREKILRNKARRANVIKDLKKTDWVAIQVWEHEIMHNAEAVADRIEPFFR